MFGLKVVEHFDVGNIEISRDLEIHNIHIWCRSWGRNVVLLDVPVHKMCTADFLVALSLFLVLVLDRLALK